METLHLPKMTFFEKLQQRHPRLVEVPGDTPRDQIPTLDPTKGCNIKKRIELIDQ